MNNIIEFFRVKIITDLFKQNTFNSVWEIWNHQIKALLGEHPTASSILNLGDNLREIFKTTGTQGRTQGELSGGGAAWESLVCWYLNICSIGSRVVAVKKFSALPSPLKDALSVNYQNFTCTTESDIVVIVFPHLNDYLNNVDNIELRDEQNEIIPIYRGGTVNLRIILDYLCTRDFTAYEVGIVQCKTNWNDNAQIPMLWDMIYNAQGFQNRNITIGKNGYSMKDVNKFTYSFVTVPSNSPTNYRSSSLAVKRVTNISGGNYWGKLSVNHVARSLKEIFNNNFQSGFTPNLRETLSQNINRINTDFDYFKLY